MSTRIIAAVIIVFTFLVIIVGISASTLVLDQFTQLVQNIPQMVGAVKQFAVDISRSKELSFIPYDIIDNQINSISRSFLQILPENPLTLLSTLTNIATVLLLVPFILFYLLRDDNLFSKYILRIVPEDHRADGEGILEDIDKTLSAYITNVVIVGMFIGVLMYLGYLMIGMNYAFILALFTAVTSVIPIVGAVLGIFACSDGGAVHARRSAGNTEDTDYYGNCPDSAEKYSISPDNGEKP